MKHIDADSILSNHLFNEEFEKAMEQYLTNFEGADLENDLVRLEAQVARRTLRLFKERFEYHVRTTN